ncbi:MAG: hypothetical protein HXY24_13785 [Rubrivivax sp.]|nr:hypothetical protein [Rubrivivax sp.]
MMIWILLVVLLGSPAFAEESVQKTEPQILAEIARRLQVAKSLVAQKVPKEHTEFCTAFLEDLKTLRNIEFVEPIVKTDDYNDPGLQSFLSKCPKLRPNKRVAFEPRIWDYAKTLPEDQREELGTVWYTTGDFRLYHVDIDNDPANGKEYLFYGGGSTSHRKQNEVRCGNYSEYDIIDLEACMRRPGQQVGDTLNCSDRTPTGNLNGIIRYRERYYIWDAQYFKVQRRYMLNLYGWQQSIDQFHRTCVFMHEAAGKAGGGP